MILFIECHILIAMTRPPHLKFELVVKRNYSFLIRPRTVTIDNACVECKLLFTVGRPHGGSWFQRYFSHQRFELISLHTLLVDIKIFSSALAIVLSVTSRFHCHNLPIHVTPRFFSNG